MIIALSNDLVNPEPVVVVCSRTLRLSSFEALHMQVFHRQNTARMSIMNRSNILALSQIFVCIASNS